MRLMMQDLLGGCRSIAAFISQAGTAYIPESVYHGVPLIGAASVISWDLRSPNTACPMRESDLFLACTGSAGWLSQHSSLHLAGWHTLVPGVTVPWGAADRRTSLSRAAHERCTGGAPGRWHRAAHEVSCEGGRLCLSAVCAESLHGQAIGADSAAQAS